MAVFDVSFLNPKLRTCTPVSKQSDLETKCGPFCGDNQKSEFELCKQAYFLREQNILLKTQNKDYVPKNNIESQSQEVAKVLEIQNQKIEKLFQDINRVYIFNILLSVFLLGALFLIMVVKIIRWIKFLKKTETPKG